MDGAQRFDIENQGPSGQAVTKLAVFGILRDGFIAGAKVSA